MNIQSLIGPGIGLSIFLGGLAVGMRVVPADLPYVLSKPSRLLVALLAMNGLPPIVAITVCKVFSLHPAVAVALVTLSIAPVGPLFSANMMPLVSPERAAYARGLFFASTVLSVVLTPLAVEAIQVLFGGDVHVSPLAVLEVVVSSVLLPLGVGLAIGRWWPVARRWIPAIQKVSTVLLLACAVVIVVGAWSLMGSLIRQWTTTAIILISLIWLAIGHFLGGPDEDDRTVLAFGCVARHPGVAIGVASFADQPLAPVGVLTTVLVSELAMAPYKAWRKRHRATAAGAAGRGPHLTVAH